MKKDIKKIIIWISGLILIAFLLIWGGTLVKNCVSTVIHKDEIENIHLIEYEEPLPEFDWYRITSYSDENIEIYYVNTLGKGTDSEYKIGGKVMCTKISGGWHHTDMTESILWSGAGSADNYIWPYWYHVFLA